MEKDICSNLAIWELVAKIHETGSLTRACIDLDIALPAGSRMLAALEKRLGQKVLRRAGARSYLAPFYLERLPDITAMLSHRDRIIEASLPAFAQTRTLRISFSSGEVSSDVNGFMRQYEQEHPEVKFVLHLNRPPRALMDGEVDIVMTATALRSEGITRFATGLVTGPLLTTDGYCAEHGVPQGVADLMQYSMVILRKPSFPPCAIIGCSGEAFDPLMQVRSPGAVHEEGDTAACLMAVLQGKGITADLSCGFAEPYVRSGQLRAVGPGMYRQPFQKYLLVRTRDMSDPIVSGFVEAFCSFERLSGATRIRRLFTLVGHPVPDEFI